jgi:drug/metabolite transporter (DMT)-like permease
MMREGLALGNVSGDLLAITTVTCFAIFSVIMRKNRANDMLPAIIIASFVTMLAGLVGAGGDLVMSTNDLWLSIVWGVNIAICGDWIFVVAVRHLTAAETTLLIMLIPSILGPVWVWWLLDEVPSDTTLVGGALVLAAVAGWALHELTSMRQPR